MIKKKETRWRIGKIEDSMHRVLAKLIHKYCSISHFGMITVSGVTISKDLSFARVYLTIFPNSKKKLGINYLNNNEKKIRLEMTKYLHLRFIPIIKFFNDDLLNISSHIDKLLELTKYPKKNYFF